MMKKMSWQKKAEWLRDSGFDFTLKLEGRMNLWVVLIEGCSPHYEGTVQGAINHAYAVLSQRKPPIRLKHTVYVGPQRTGKTYQMQALARDYGGVVLQGEITERESWPVPVVTWKKAIEMLAGDEPTIFFIDNLEMLLAEGDMPEARGFLEAISGSSRHILVTAVQSQMAVRRLLPSDFFDNGNYHIDYLS